MFSTNIHILNLITLYSDFDKKQSSGEVRSGGLARFRPTPVRYGTALSVSGDGLPHGRAPARSEAVVLRGFS